MRSDGRRRARRHPGRDHPQRRRCRRQRRGPGGADPRSGRGRRRRGRARPVGLNRV
ncbi:hypothetical protein MTBSS4_180035 [Magnetospirillum sp. SS-4]|nr:hypothetical protein MTBSS4_180035 [Magnetospirillum sp. SS-4]